MTGPRPFAADERARFHNLLKLAAETTYDGERANALAAAERMAARCGMSMEEAARGGPPPRQARSTRGQGRRSPDDGRSYRPNATGDQDIAADKTRRAQAIRDAIRRGLDQAERGARRRAAARPAVRSQARLSPRHFASILLTETSLPFREIAVITGLDIYQVISLKLQLRG